MTNNINEKMKLAFIMTDSTDKMKISTLLCNEDSQKTTTPTNETISTLANQTFTAQALEASTHETIKTARKIKSNKTKEALDLMSKFNAYEMTLMDSNASYEEKMEAQFFLLDTASKKKNLFKDIAPLKIIESLQGNTKAFLIGLSKYCKALIIKENFPQETRLTLESLNVVTRLNIENKYYNQLKIACINLKIDIAILLSIPVYEFYTELYNLKNLMNETNLIASNEPNKKQKI